MKRDANNAMPWPSAGPEGIFPNSAGHSKFISSDFNWTKGQMFLFLGLGAVTKEYYGHFVMLPSNIKTVSNIDAEHGQVI